jgi:FkbM family methyltransferase
MKNKILKKIIGLTGYKLIEKNLFKNNRTLSKNTLINLDNILKFIFSNHNINSLVQVGANDGQSFDGLNFYIKKYNPKSILVEPIKESFLKLQKSYKDQSNVKLENSAISVDNEISFLYKVNSKFEKMYGSHIPAIPSFNKKHLVNHGVKSRHIVQEKINTISVKNLLNKYEIDRLDLFFVDAEGYDGKIIYDLLSTTNFRPFIIFEFIHIENSIFEKLNKKLVDSNYLFFAVDENIFCLPDDKNFLIIK